MVLGEESRTTSRSRSRSVLLKTSIHLPNLIRIRHHLVPVRDRSPFRKAPPVSRDRSVPASNAAQDTSTTTKSAPKVRKAIPPIPSAMLPESSVERLTVGSSATDSTSATHATVATSASMDLTNAPSAVAPTMELKLMPEPSPLKPDGFKDFLNRLDLTHAFPSMVKSLVEGFDFGIPPIRSTVIQKNHCSAEEDLEILHGIVEKEIAVGRVVGPFSKDEVENMLGPFQTSPLGLVPKPGGK
ncbi:hypothetical protein CF327_g5284 [Tilletia walkeri]|nr:hypothetical protein CF327_g5284 [Tilletia walkeri]